MRRKGVPCGCTDNGGCCGLKEKLAILWDRTIGSILKINDQTPDGDGKFRILEGDNIEITDVSNGIRIGVDPTQDLTLQADLTVDGDATFNGDIIQNGSAYETHAQKVYTTDDYIITRDGAVGALGAGDYSGFQVTKYDGTNDGRLVVDRDGTARVGDVGDEQPLATRDESAQLTGNHILKWDADDLKLVDSGIDADSLGGGLELVDTLSSEVYVPAIDNMDGIHTINMGPFEAGYDYFLFIHVAGGENANIRARYDSITIGTTAIDLKIQTSASVTFNARLYRCPTSNPLINSVRLSTVGSARTNDQEILVSGVNIKTINSTDILGSGDITIGGMTWTKRTANDDWTDMFEAGAGVTIRAKKNILIYQTNARNPMFIPKGFEGLINIDYHDTTYPVVNGTIYLINDTSISQDRLTNTYSSLTGSRTGFSLSTDGSTVTITPQRTTGVTIPKGNFIIWTAD